ncbi:uncharacterized protein LOC117171098 [Belonocnema kinseyi]|uniref:uncharacterized protein LOC117171098 n=1 Tax=Belonocnema kinseyi TaxID=2817044 RepID=UPI00143D0381|nr:uncharacterized protein LOC117171098 [Belonocnema kinseyi]
MTQRIVQEPSTVVATEVMGYFLRSKKGYEHLLVFQDLFSKWIKFAPLKKANAESINVAFLKLVVTRWSTSKVLHSDNGAEFNNNAVNKLAVEIIETGTPAFLNLEQEARSRKTIRSLREGEAELPPPDLQVWPTQMARLEHLRILERIPSTIENVLKTNIEVHNAEWNRNLKIICMAYNTMKHCSTGYSPFLLTFGREAYLSSMPSTIANVKYEELLDLWKRIHKHYLEKANEKIETQELKYKQLQDSRIAIPQGIHEPGDLMKLINDYQATKLSPSRKIRSNDACKNKSEKGLKAAGFGGSVLC